MVTTERPIVVAAGARVRRDDGQVLMVRHRAGVAAGRWAVPFIAVDEREVAESAATRVLRDALRIEPGMLEFAHTLVIPNGDEDVVINVFDAVGWSGEPRYSGRDFDDAGWIDPAIAAGVDVVPEVASWLSGAAVVVEDVHEELTRALVDARGTLLAAYEAIPVSMRERELEGGWAPVDVLHHVASREAYTIDEAVRFAERPGHAWRDFNSEQSESERRIRRRPSDAEAHARIVAVQDDTLRMLEALMPEQLAHVGLRDGVKSVTTVREQIAALPEHDEEHARQLRSMADAARRIAREEGR